MEISERNILYAWHPLLHRGISPANGFNPWESAGRFKRCRHSRAILLLKSESRRPDSSLKADPKKVQAYNELALADLARVRETADSRYLTDAETALAQGLSLDANNFQLQRTQVALMLSRHQFVPAKERARALNRRTPDDVMTYGYLAETDIALGNYPEAETNVQWMLNLRPNNIPGLLIGAELRRVYGDTQGRDRDIFSTWHLLRRLRQK